MFGTPAGGAPNFRRPDERKGTENGATRRVGPFASPGASTVCNPFGFAPTSSLYGFSRFALDVPTPSGPRPSLVLGALFNHPSCCLLARRSFSRATVSPKSRGTVTHHGRYANVYERGSLRETTRSLSPVFEGRVNFAAILTRRSQQARARAIRKPGRSRPPPPPRSGNISRAYVVV